MGYWEGRNERLVEERERNRIEEIGLSGGSCGGSVGWGEGTDGKGGGFYGPVDILSVALHLAFYSISFQSDCHLPIFPFSSNTFDSIQLSPLYPIHRFPANLFHSFQSSCV